MSSITFEPLIPAALWVTLALLGAALIIWYAWRRPSVVTRSRWTFVVALMSIAFGGVMLILLNPNWTRQLPPPPGKPMLTILVDASASMATPDAAGGANRFDAASAVVRAIDKSLADRFDLRVETFSTELSATDEGGLKAVDPTKGNATDVAAAISGALDQERVRGQAIALLSDGIHNAEGGAARVLDAVRAAKAMGTPIYTETFGGQARGWDLAIDLRSAQDLAIVGQKIPVSARIRATGLGGGHAQVVLLEGGKEIARRDALLQAGAGSSADVHFMVTHDKIGVYPYEIRVEPLPGEVSQANNSASYVLRVVDEPIRVLVLEGKPYWDSKFFTRTLTADPAVALDAIVRLKDDRLIRRTLSRTDRSATTKPGGDDSTRVETWKIVNNPADVLATPESLKGYQIVVLGRDAESFLTDAAISNLQNWISREGGALVCYRGSPMAQVDQRLARLLPVRWTPGSESRFRLKMTDQGRNLHWLSDAPADADQLAAMPTLASRAVMDQSKPLAVVLATSVAPSGQASPAVIYQPYGSGRVVVIEGSGMWRWAFLPPQYQDLEEVYASLWHSLMRWLTSGANLLPGQKINLRADKVRFATDESVTATLLVRDEGSTKSALPAIELTIEGSKDGKSFAPSPVGEEAGVFRVSFGKLAEGRYSAHVAGAKDDDAGTRVVFDVRKFGDEQINLEARPDLMQRIATDSGGAVLQADAAPSEIASKFKEHLDHLRPPRLERTTAWDKWWVMLAVIGLWGMSWAVRRSGGLV